MIAVLVLVCLAVLAGIVAKLYPKIDVVKMAVFAVCGFFFLYTVVSGRFFWVDRFDFIPVLAVCLTAELIILLALQVRNPAWEITFDYKKSLIPVIIMLCALPFTAQKFELYSMGQDQGTYQVKALYMMERDTGNYIEMEEFNKLDTQQERQKYLDFIYDQNNFYLPRVEWETDTDAAHFDHITGAIHGLPTYPALLALWGKIFGYENMIGVQTPLYLGIIFLSWYVCENVGLRRRTAAMVTALMAFSPIMVWLSKSSLTETGLTLLVCAFLYFLTEPEETGRPELCMLPMIVFSFFHISLYAFMPVFVIVLFVMYISRRDRRWLAAIAGGTAGYGLGTVWALQIAPYYSYGNYSELTRVTGGIINEHRLVPVVAGACILVIAACAVLWHPKTSEALWKRLDRLGERRAAWERAAYVLLRLFLILSVAFFVYKGIITAETETACEYLQISTYIYMSGILLVPLVYLVLFFRPGSYAKDAVTVNIMLLFLYCVVFYSMVMRVRILFYYYFARYAAIFLLVIFLMAAIALERWKPFITMLVFGLALFSFVPYDKGLMVQKDHSRCEWEFLADVCEDIGENDALIVGPEEQQIVFIFPVKAITGCDVYYADEKLDSQLVKLSQRYEHVYYMDYDTAFEDSWAASERLAGVQVSKIYTNWNHLSYLDYFNITNPFTPIPLNYVEYRLKLSLYEIGSEVEE